MKQVRALAAMGALLLLVAGVPFVLSGGGGTAQVVADAAASPEAAAIASPESWTIFFDILRVLGWVLWITFAVALVIAIPYVLSGRKVPALPGLRWQQRLAVGLLSAVVIAIAPQAAIAAPVVPAPPPAVSQEIPFVFDESEAAAAGMRIVEVQPGESLWHVAQRHLGDGRFWSQIAALNYGLPQADGSSLEPTNVLQPGWKLRIPSTQNGGVGIRATELSSFPVNLPVAPEFTGEAPAAELQPSAPDGEPPASSTATDPAAGALANAVGRAAAERADSRPATTAAAEDASAAAADGEDVEEAELAPPATTTGGMGGVLSSGVIGVLAFKRRETERGRAPGLRVVAPAPASREAALECQLRAITAPLPLELVDRTMRSLAETHHRYSRPLPDLRAARLTSDAIELYLGQPAMLPVPWEGSSDGLVWTISAGAATALPPAYGALAPFPTLVTVGVDELGAHIMLDLEHVVSLDIRGEEELASASIAALAAELATTPWADDLAVTLVGAFPELGETLDAARLRHVPSLDAVIGELEARADAVSAALAAAGTDSILVAQAAGFLPLDWRPEVLLIPGALSPAQSARLQAVHVRNPRVGIAAVTTGDDGEWALAADDQFPGRAILEPAGLPVRVQQLQPQEYADVIALLTGTRTLVPGPDWAANLAAAEPALADLAGLDPRAAAGPEANPLESAVSGTIPAPTFPDLLPGAGLAAAVSATSAPSVASADAPSAPSAPDAGVLQMMQDLAGSSPSASSGPEAEVTPLRQPLVRVLGCVDLVAPAGPEPSDKDRSQALELIAYLALTPGATNDQLSAALWPGREPKNATRNSAVSRARRWLGADHEGEPYLPIATTSETFGTYSLDGVSTDWENFLAIVGADAATASTASLLHALDLVRGKPFDGVRVGKYTWADPFIREMTASIVDVAHEVARRSLLAGDIRGAKWACAVGLAVTGDDERLWRSAMKAEWLGGDQRALWDLVRRCHDYFADLGVSLESETETLVDQLRTAASAVN